MAPDTPLADAYVVPMPPKSRQARDARSLEAPPAPPPAPQFERDTIRLVVSLRELFTALIRALPHSVRTASELQRATGLDMKLCWKVFRVINAAEALAGAQYVPTPANSRDLLASFAKRGAPAGLLERTAAAMKDFERLVVEHAGDRRTFDSMVSSFGAEESEKADLRQRKSVFQAASHLWGVQADAMAFALIVRPTDSNPDVLDQVALGGEYGLRRLRPTPFPLYARTLQNLDDLGKSMGPVARTPLDGEAPARLPLLTRFCSQPLPQIERREREDGTTLINLTNEGLGMKAAMDVVAGFRMPASSHRYRTPPADAMGHLTADVSKPARVILMDLIVEQGTFESELRPTGHMFPARVGVDVQPRDIPQTPHLLGPAPAQRLGRGPEMLATPEIPRYAEMVEWSIRKAGWDPERFEAWRVRVEYPLVSSFVVLLHDLPERAAPH